MIGVCLLWMPLSFTLQFTSSRQSLFGLILYATALVGL